MLSKAYSRTERRATNLDLEINQITGFIRNQVSDSGASGVVVGLSGGIDSSVAAFLCVKALGRERVLGLLLFENEFRDSGDYQDAVNIAKMLEIRTCNIKLSSLERIAERNLKPFLGQLSRLTRGNLKARLRMILLYAFANEEKLLVVGTGDRSEELLGYFTKFGDGAADIMPVAHLYKTDVRAIASRLKVPFRIISKPSSPNLWRGQKASQELPAEYEVLDPILTLLFDRKMTPSRVASILRVPQSLVKEVASRNDKTKHKRELPLSIR